MKKAALIAAALAMTLSLAACGNRDNNTTDNQTNGTTENGTTTNGTNGGSTTNGTTNGTTGSNDSIGGSTGTDAGLGNNGTGSSVGTGTDTGTTRSSVGNDLRRAADDVGDAVTGLMDDGRSAVARGTNTTSFQRMLNNARVHDVDGVLTDGENSRW